MTTTTARYGFPKPELTDLVTDGWDAIADLADSVETTLGTVADGLDGRLDVIEPIVADHETRLDAVADHEARIDVLEAGATVAAVAARVDALEVLYWTGA